MQLFRILVCAALVCVGCADVTVQRIHDGNRNSATGFRYYLPRPYIVVKKPFVVAGNDYFAYGQVDSANRVVKVAASQLPGFLNFPADPANPAGTALVPYGSIRPAEATAAKPASRSTAARHSGGGSASPAATGTEFLLDDKKWLAGSTVSPTILPETATSLKAVVKLAKAAELGVVSLVTPGLVPTPTAGAKPTEFAALIPLEGASGDAAWAQGSTDGQYTGVGSREAVKSGTTYSFALRFQGSLKATPTEIKTYVIYDVAPILFVQGTKPPASDEKKEKGKASQYDVITEAGVTTSGDPRTSPHRVLTDLFDVLYLPDMDEQYAVCVKGGIGLANATIGLENGWMMERASVKIDNRELGRFILNNVDKFTDIAADIARAKLLPAGGFNPEQETDSERQSGGRYVLLRIRYVREAQPGVFPVVKKSELDWLQSRLDCLNQMGSGAEVYGNPRDHLLLPYPPYTVFAHNVRTQVLIEAVRGQYQTPQRAAGTGLSDADLKAARTWLLGNGGFDASNKAALQRINGGSLLVNTVDESKATLKLSMPAQLWNGDSAHAIPPFKSAWNTQATLETINAALKSPSQKLEIGGKRIVSFTWTTKD